MSELQLRLRINELECVLLKICEGARRTDIHGNGALEDLVPPYLINEAYSILDLKAAP